MPNDEVACFKVIRIYFKFQKKNSTLKKYENTVDFL